MQNLIFVLLCSTSLISCSSNPSTAQVADTLIVDQVQQNSALMIDSAKTLLNNSNYWVEKRIS